MKNKCLPCYREVSEESRAKILSFLEKRGPAPVARMVELLKLRQPTVSYHLHRLETAGILKSKKQGRQVIYEIDLKCGKKSEGGCGLV